MTIVTPAAFSLSSRSRISFGRHRIEVPGRFVGEDELRRVDEAAGNAGPLLLSAGKLCRTVIEALPQADQFGQFAHAAVVFGGDVAPIGERRGDILEDRQLGDQIVCLEDEADPFGPNRRQGIVVQFRDVVGADPVFPVGRLVQAAEQVQERTLAGTGRSHDGDVVTLGNFEIDPFENP